MTAPAPNNRAAPEAIPGRGARPARPVCARRTSGSSGSWGLRLGEPIVLTIGVARTLLAAFLAAILACLSARAQQQELSPAQQKAADLRIPALDRTAFLPERRAPTEVPEGERNPFGKSLPPPTEEKEIEPVKVETEEMKLRRVLGNMRASGLSGTPGDYTVLVGPLSLRAGQTVPKLFSDQAEVLRVESVSEREVVLSFVEKNPNLPPRFMSLSVDMKPRVNSVLAGELFTNTVTFDAKGAVNLKPLEGVGVKAVTTGLTNQELQSLVDRSRALMGEAAVPLNDDEP